MRRRWYYIRRMFRGNRLFRSFMICGWIAAVLLGIWAIREPTAWGIRWTYEEYGVAAARNVMKQWISVDSGGHFMDRWGKTEVLSYLERLKPPLELAEDPAYERMLAAEWENQLQEQIRIENMEAWEDEINQAVQSEEDPETGEVIARKAAGSFLIREKLGDFDYLIQNFYTIHPTTTADRSMVNAEEFLSMDLSLDKSMDGPQILIYHTHSQEEFADHPKNPDATIVGVGTYLTKLLEARGYRVIHDTTVYDMRNGKLDRNEAYTYALEGIQGILQKHPTIQVVLDLHRDGVDEQTRLVTEINGKPTARIMFFNGTSQTPDGPIEYLPNPNRSANLAFSLQMQLLAAEQYPGFTRKIYLKGLRYNQHVRARTALIEVGAQTNTYAEALNAMEPLADILCRVLEGDGSES